MFNAFRGINGPRPRPRRSEASFAPKHLNSMLSVEFSGGTEFIQNLSFLLFSSINIAKSYFFDILTKSVLAHSGYLLCNCFCGNYQYVWCAYYEALTLPTQISNTASVSPNSKQFGARR